MGVTDSTTPCVGCKGTSFDTAVVVLGIIGEAVGSTVSTGST